MAVTFSWLLVFGLATCLAFVFVAGRYPYLTRKARPTRVFAHGENATLRLPTYRPGWLDADPDGGAAIRRARQRRRDGRK